MAQTVGVVLKPGVPEAVSAFRALQAQFREVRFVVENRGHTAPGVDLMGVHRIDPGLFDTECDLVLAFGGDGTLIHAASLLQHCVVPILGVNMGRIGFLAEVSCDELIASFPLALRGELPSSDRMRLDATVWGGGQLAMQRRVLNDAVVSLQALARIATYRVHVRDELVTTIRGDGVIVSTPTGSTAYAMAAGGSILSPSLEAIAITPICPHQLTQRSIIVVPEGNVQITLDSDSAAFVTLDGQSGRALTRGDRVVLSRAPVPTRIMSHAGRNYFDTLRVKLGWGER